MASPTIDGSFAGAIYKNTNTGSVALTTTQTNDVIICEVAAENNAGSLQSVTSVTSAHLTFTKRFRKTTANQFIEVWAAPSTGVLTSETITANLSGNVGVGIIGCYGVHGCFSISSPWDPNAGVPASNTGGGGSAPVVTFSTTEADNLLIAFSEVDSNNGCTAPSGYTALSTGSAFETTNFTALGWGIYYKSVSSSQSGATFQDAATISAHWLSVVDALTADPSSNTETGTVVMGFGGIALNVAGTDSQSASTRLTFGPIAMNVAGSVGDSGTAVLAFGGIALNVHGAVEDVGTAVMAFGGLGLAVLGANTGPSPSPTNLVVQDAYDADLQPLTWNVPIAEYRTGNPSAEFQKKWEIAIKRLIAQADINKTIVPKSYIDQQDQNVLSGAQTFAKNYADAICQSVVYKPCIVSALPVASTGARGMVTDCTTTLALGLGTAPTGGGSNIVPVYNAGGTWLIG